MSTALHSWRDEAACAGRVDIDWDPEGAGKAAPQPVHEAPALALCQRCPVRPQCLDHALSLPVMSDHGIVGGTTRRERLDMRAARRRLTA